MLRVSTKGEYGVRIMVDLARHYGDRPRSLTDISQAEMLPLAYLEQLVKLLREADPPLVISTRGAHGGYRLSRDPGTISMGEIVRILEGPIAPMICATEGEMTQICGFLDSCRTKYLWARVRDAVAKTLDSITLAELVAESGEDQQNPAHFIALSDIHVGINATDYSLDKDGGSQVRPLA
ncbi:Rrf2 family transcriptional regulator [Ktedonosporobacter rubrisoli]|uniref:Rrf2 family transcriptional regulator n=2 Tax=Ktedonosporobacter rubrisoli TaxID=2509675 RepID=A0A4P6K6A6_KTERU|nr:Rrf2 family transcriptional regulator [Ktedonosporobacter rubrisoli]QBD83665.1 Rrf2 family transcriptional regulator [Ktedonosporobacter rubrisoli]